MIHLQSMMFTSQIPPLKLRKSKRPTSAWRSRLHPIHLAVPLLARPGLCGHSAGPAGWKRFRLPAPSPLPTASRTRCTPAPCPYWNPQTRTVNDGSCVGIQVQLSERWVEAALLSSVFGVDINQQGWNGRIVPASLICSCSPFEQDSSAEQKRPALTPNSETSSPPLMDVGRSCCSRPPTVGGRNGLSDCTCDIQISSGSRSSVWYIKIITSHVSLSKHKHCLFFL